MLDNRSKILWDLIPDGQKGRVLNYLLQEGLEKDLGESSIESRINEIIMKILENSR